MIEVRYLSHSGNTKRIAEAIAEGASTTALSITDEPALTEHVDILFLGGAPYANIMDPKLREFAENIKPEMVSKPNTRISRQLLVKVYRELRPVCG